MTMNKPVGFWGLALTSDNPFTHVAPCSYTITMAAFDSKLEENERTSVLMTRNNSSKYILCNLIPGVIEQHILNQTIFAGETVTIYVEGKNKVHLTGNSLSYFNTEVSNNFYGMLSTSKVNGEAKNSNKNEAEGNVRGNGKLKRSIDTLNSSIANNSADNDDFNDDDNVTNKSKGKKKNVKKNNKEAKSSSSSNNNNNDKDGKDVEEINGEKKQVKKRKTNSGTKNADSGLDDLDDDNDNQNKASGTNEKATTNNQKTNKKKSEMKHQQENSTNQINNKNESPEEKQANNKNKKKKDNHSKTNEEKKEAALPKSSNDKSPNSQEKKVMNVNGVSITEAKVGNGKQAKNGKKVGVRYIGRLKKNGHVFDSNTTGKPFFFTLGKSEVIKGWDLGINGMCVGGERKLVIPPALAYGTKGHPPTIPKNAILEFEVKLLQVD